MKKTERDFYRNKQIFLPVVNSHIFLCILLQSIKIPKASQEVFFLLSKASRNPGELITFKTPCRSHMGIYSVLSLKKNFSVEMGKGKCSCEALAFIKKWSCQVNQVKLTSTILWSCDSVKSTAKVCSKE